jgi:hypothetical protein
MGWRSIVRRRSVAIAVTLAFGCGVAAGGGGYRLYCKRMPDPTPDAGPPVVPDAGPRTGLYTDAEAEAIIRRWGEQGEDGPTGALSIVPNGTEAPLFTVLGALGIEQSRLKFKTEYGVNQVMYVGWQMSPSYDFGYLTGIIFEDRAHLSRDDPARMVYGIAISKRDK